MRTSEIDVLVDRLRDRRSGKVAFVSHCLLNENTRYLGGACRACCVREVVDQLVDREIGIVQMPCPEQLAWGGVLKRRMLRLYGTPRAAALSGVARVYSRFVFGRLARRIAAQVADYVAPRYGQLPLAVTGFADESVAHCRSQVDPFAHVSEHEPVHEM